METFHMNLPRHALATVELYRTEDGGRVGPLLAGKWLVDVRIGNETRLYYSARVDIDEELHPGQALRAYLAFGCPEMVGPLVEPGTRIFYCAGHAVGQGEILELYLSDEERQGDGLSTSDRIAEWDERDRLGIRHVRTTLDALLDRRLCLTEGVREVLKWANDARSLDRSLLGPFIGFDSETAQFPVGDVRNYWHEHRLAELDAVRIPLEQHYERLLMGAARRLRTSLSQLDDQ
jgi:hypothetical protein